MRSAVVRILAQVGLLLQAGGRALPRGNVRVTRNDLRGDRAYLNERLWINLRDCEELNLTAAEFRFVAVETEEANVT